ncbi:MAG: cytochrome c [Chloroflexi bacterium]|nr:MAG: cytochrome c [Chloroflexota bacterium]
MTIDLNVVLAVLSGLLFFGFVAFFAFLIYHQREVEPKEPRFTGAEIIEQHYAPGATVEQPTPYYVAPIPAAPDPLEISANLDKKIVIGGGMVFGFFALLGVYFFYLFVLRADASADPGRWRDRVAFSHQEEKLIERGRNLYANFCFDCHGKTGLGSADPSRKDLPGLPLNKPDFKYVTLMADPAKLKAAQDLITHTIERGRNKGPGQISMPAWSDKEGGSLNDEQIEQLVSFIMKGTDTDWADVVTVRQHSQGTEDGHLPLEPEDEPDPAGAEPRPVRGRGPAQRREQAGQGLGRCGLALQVGLERSRDQAGYRHAGLQQQERRSVERRSDQGDRGIPEHPGEVT